MGEYFIEFEFKSLLRDTYWLPLRIKAENSDEAQRLATSLESGIREHYELIRRSDITPIIEGINSTFINTYFTNRMSGKVRKLTLQLWEFKDIAGIPELSFGEHLSLVPLPVGDALVDERVIASARNYMIPVRLVLSDWHDRTDNEFILIHVVKPS